MTGRAAHKTHSAPVQQQRSLGGRQRVSTAVQVQPYQPARRSSKVVDPGDGLLTPVTALVQVDGNAKQVNLIRDGSVVGVEADPWHTGSDPMCLESPGAGSWTAVNDISELIAWHEELAATERVRADSDKVVAGQLCSRL